MDVRTMHVGPTEGGWLTWTDQGQADRHSSRATAVQAALLWAFVYRPARVVLHADGREELLQWYPERGVEPGRVASALPELYV